MDTTRPKRAAFRPTFDPRAAFGEMLSVVNRTLAAGLPADVAGERFRALVEAARALLDPGASPDAPLSLTAWAVRARKTREAMKARPPRKARPVEAHR